MSTARKILDVACGSRMFWFDKRDPRALFVDNRSESHVLPDKSSKGGSRTLLIAPDAQIDFKGDSLTCCSVSWRKRSASPAGS